eukprot:5750071-Pleurochrysis_carterae.AAC.1
MLMRDFDDSDAAARRKRKINGMSEQRAVEYFHTLPVAEQEAAVLVAMKMRAQTRASRREQISRSSSGTSRTSASRRRSA